MRRTISLIALATVVIATMTPVSVSVSATISGPKSCSAISLRITEYGIDVGMSTARDLYWIRNDSDETCTLRGFVRVSYFGVVLPNSPTKVPTLLAVSQSTTRGFDTDGIGGLKKGVAVPTVTLAPRGVASFWIFGTDGSYRLDNGQQSRCIMSHRMLVRLPATTIPIVVIPLRAAAFFWCGGVDVTPVTSGDTGTDPYRPLSYFSGMIR